MVLQETWLKDGTVLENILFGRKDASREEAVEAAKLSHAHSFIKRLPQGYDTIVKENGETIKNADIILVMKDGKIIEQGNHEELLAKKGFYTNLYMSQFAAD